MTGFAEISQAAYGASDLRQVADLLGGDRVLLRTLHGPLDAHDMLVQGLPGPALTHLLDSLVVLRPTPALHKAVGMSLRTVQRTKDAPTRRLSQDQSDRTWKFAEILAKATGVFGTQRDAEEWLERPAIGLDQRCPIDLLATTAGTEMVEDFLQRLEYGVYM